jgi:hypothetical protein
MLESFGMHTGGKEYRRLVGAFERIFGATIFVGTDPFPFLRKSNSTLNRAFG